MGIATVFRAGRRLTAAELNLRPYAHLYQTVTQPLTNNTPAAITLNASFVDTINGHDTTPPLHTRYEPSVPGWYHCWGQVAFAGNTTNDRSARIRKNGITVDEGPYSGQPSMKVAGFLAGIATCQATVFLNGGGDYIELWGHHNAGVTLNTFYGPGLTNSYLICEWKAP